MQRLISSYEIPYFNIGLSFKTPDSPPRQRRNISPVSLSKVTALGLLIGELICKDEFQLISIITILCSYSLRATRAFKPRMIVFHLYGNFYKAKITHLK